MIEKIYQIFLASTGVCTDTREIKKGNLFFALKGPNFNANKFAEKAIGLGASMVIIDDEDFEIPGKTIMVPDGLIALQELASLHRSSLQIPIIGLTGSNGKTTTKELIYAVLSASFRTVATKGNLNNHIGVPLSVLSINNNHEMAIIEMGANHVGEIAFLSSICRPTHGLITNIGKAHTGLFGGLEGVIRAKSELYDFFIKNNGTVFINQNQNILMNMSKRIKNTFFYPNDGSYCPSEFLGADPFVKVKTEKGNSIDSKMIGGYNFENIATALCLAKFFEVPEQKAIDAIATYTPENNRSQLIKKGNNIIILDAYNANPSSMEKALENLSQMKSINKTVILGDMFELGEDAKKEHRRVGEIVKSMNFENAIFCGETMKYASESHGNAIYVETKKSLLGHLKAHKIQNSTILIKASRGMALEDVVGFL